MYGLVNKAVRDLVVAEFGEAQWVAIADAAGVDHQFISMQSYDDQVTYDLVSHASELLNVPANELLRQFGSYWIRFTATEGYGHLVSLFGDTLEEFLEKLGNDLHARVAITMPELKPPEFRTEKVAAHSYVVFYTSHRRGLQPMVLGLLEGLAERFGEIATVTHLDSQEGNGVITESFRVDVQVH